MIGPVPTLVLGPPIRASVQCSSKFDRVITPSSLPALSTTG